MSSDLVGNIESPEFNFKNNAGTAEAMDNLMLTHGWRRFKWEDILHNKKPTFEFAPEHSGLTILGKITNTSTKQPAKDIKAFLSISSTRSLYKSISDNLDYVKFNVKNFYSQSRLTAQCDSSHNSLYDIEIVSPFSQKYSADILPAFSLAQMNKSVLINNNTINRVQTNYNGKKLRQLLPPDTDTLPFYFRPDETYLLDNYMRFTTLEEVLTEYVTPVGVRKKGDKFHLVSWDILRSKFFETDPLIMLDGVPIFDINKLMAYDPLKIKKLEVVSRLYYLGNLSFSGIVNFITYKGNLPDYELEPHTTILDYEGLQLKREFPTTTYETQQQIANRLPDYRSLLYWSPDIKTDKSGKKEVSFYTSDLPGKYIIILQGLSNNAQIGSKTVVFEVRP